VHELVDTALGTLISPMDLFFVLGLFAALYLTRSLGITFPFTLVIGIPLYEAAAQIVSANDDARVASAQPIYGFLEER
jgi:hypothetical protein